MDIDSLIAPQPMGEEAPLADSVVFELRRLASRHQLTLNAIFLGSLAALLHGLSGQSDFAIMQT